MVNGSRLQWHEYEIEIFHLGGQTFYHADLAIEVDGHCILFVGDAFYGWNPALEPVLCFNDCEPTTRGWVYDLERIIERNPDLLVCGLGSAILNPLPLIRMKWERWQRRLQEYSVLEAHCDSYLFFTPVLKKYSHSDNNSLEQKQPCLFNDGPLSR